MRLGSEQRLDLRQVARVLDRASGNAAITRSYIARQPGSSPISRP